MEAPLEEVIQVCRSLGFANRRTANLKKMTKAYLAGGWNHARDLPGIGEYASAAWEIFCQGTLPEKAPKDGALVRYWDWRKGTC